MKSKLYKFAAGWLPITALMTLFVWCSARAEPKGESLSQAERAFVASKIYSSLGLYFAHWAGTAGLDFDAAYKGYLARALEAEGRREFDLATMEFIARFKNKHTQFDDQWLRQNFGQPLGFGAAPVEGKWAIAWTQDERLEKGDIIRAIDGTEVEAFVRDHEKYINASSLRSARNLVFDRSYLFPERFTLSMDDGREITIQRAVHDSKPADSASPPVASEGRWLREDSIAYIKIPSFNDPAFETSAIEFAKRFHRARSLIVDVRNNGGGRTPYPLIRELMDREWRSWASSTPLHNALDRARGAPATEIRVEDERSRPMEGAFTGRLILLVDHFTCSAAEDFVMPFKDNGRAAIVGETTEGSSGQPYFFNFENGMTLMVGAERHVFPDGSAFESVGIGPTVSVEPRLDDLKNGSDRILEKAQEIAGSP